MLCSLLMIDLFVFSLCRVLKMRVMTMLCSLLMIYLFVFSLCCAVENESHDYAVFTVYD